MTQAHQATAYCERCGTKKPSARCETPPPGTFAHYVLEGRDVIEREDEVSGPCIFCGKALAHFNDGGDGWLLGAIVDGKVRYFLYCRFFDCTPGMEHEIWRCAAGDYVENVGSHCHDCGCPRSEARTVPS